MLKNKKSNDIMRVIDEKNYNIFYNSYYTNMFYCY